MSFEFNCFTIDSHFLMKRISLASFHLTSMLIAFFSVIHLSHTYNGICTDTLSFFCFSDRLMMKQHWSYPSVMNIPTISYSIFFNFWTIMNKLPISTNFTFFLNSQFVKWFEQRRMTTFLNENMIFFISIVCSSMFTSRKLSHLLTCPTSSVETKNSCSCTDDSCFFFAPKFWCSRTQYTDLFVIRKNCSLSKRCAWDRSS